MSALYTVKLHQKKLISTFDMKGRKIGDREELIEVTLTDLPLPTAQMYRVTDSNGTCQIIKQAPMQPKSRSGISRSAETRAGGKVRTNAPPAPKIDAKTQAARSGDLAAAINQN